MPGLGVGDRAVDLIVAWNLLDAEAREVFRETLGMDAATWDRGRGWALSVSVIALPFYEGSGLPIVAISRRTIREVLAAGRRAA